MHMHMHVHCTCTARSLHMHCTCTSLRVLERLVRPVTTSVEVGTGNGLAAGQRWLEGKVASLYRPSLQDHEGTMKGEG